MKAAYLNTLRWSPVVVQAALMFTIATMTTFLDKSADLTQPKVQAWFWLDYLRFIAAPIISGLVALNAFFNNSYAQHKQKLASEDNHPVPAVVHP